MLFHAVILSNPPKEFNQPIQLASNWPAQTFDNLVKSFDGPVYIR